MADFTIEGIIDVDASRGIRSVRKFKNELKGLMAELEAVDSMIRDLDGSEIDVKINTQNKQALNDLKEDLDSIRDEDVNIDIAVEAAGEAQRILDELEAKTEEGIDIPVDLDDDPAMREFERLHQELMDLGKRDVSIDVDLEGGKDVLAEAAKLHEEVDKVLGKADIEVGADTKNIDKLKESFKGASGALGGIGGAGLIGGIVALTSLLGPLGAVTAGVAGGMTGSFGVMGVAVGSFFAFAKPAIKDITESVKLLATNTDELDAAGLEKYNEQVAIMKEANPDIWEAAQAFLKLKDNYTEWADKLRPTVIDIFAGSLRVLNTLVGYTGPIALEAGDAFAKMMDRINGGLKTDEWESFFGYVEENSGKFIGQWSQIVGNFLTGIANMIVGLDPLTQFFNKGLLGWSESFRNWSKTFDESDGFKRFVAYVKENGPLVWDVLKQLGDAIVNFIIDLAPLGEKILQVADKWLTFYNRLHDTNPQAAEALTKFIAISAILAPMAGSLGALAGPLGGIATGFWNIVTKGEGIAGLLGGAGGAAGGAAGGFSALSIAAVGIGALFVAIGGALAFLSPQTDSYNGMMEHLHDLWDKIVEVGGKVWGIIKDLYDVLESSGAIDQFQQAFGKFFDILVQLMPLLEPLAVIIAGPVVGALIAFAYALNIVMSSIQGLVHLVGPVIEWIVDKFMWMFNVLVGHSIVPDLINSIINWFGRLPGALGGMVMSAVHSVIDKFTQMKNSAVAKAQEIKSSVTQRWSEITAATSSKFNEMKNAGVSRFNELRAGVTSRANEIKNSIQTHFEQARQSATQKFTEMKNSAATKFGEIVTSARTKLGQVKGAVTGAFSGAGGWLLSAGSSIIGGLISGIQNGMSRLGGALSSVSGFIRSHKGPESYDKVMLEPAGGYIMDGLINGIVKKKGPLYGELNAITKDIASAFGGSSAFGTVPISADVAGAASLSGGGGATVNNYYDIKVDIPVGGDLVEAGRQVVGAIDAYETAGGRKKRK